MSSKEEINRINEILSCDNCPASYACEACDITWTDKDLIKKYISELEQSNEELEKENNRLEKIEFERDKANKIIDEMAEQLAGLAIWDVEEDETRFLGDAEEVKQYFEKKVDEEKC